MYRLGNSGLFYAKPDRKKPSTLSGLKTNPVCTGEVETINKQSTENKRVNPDNVKPKKNEWVNPDEVQTIPSKKKDEWVNPDTLL